MELKEDCVLNLDAAVVSDPFVWLDVIVIAVLAIWKPRSGGHWIKKAKAETRVEHK